MKGTVESGNIGKLILGMIIRSPVPGTISVEFKLIVRSLRSMALNAKDTFLRISLSVS